VSRTRLTSEILVGFQNFPATVRRVHANDGKLDWGGVPSIKRKIYAEKNQIILSKRGIKAKHFNYKWAIVLITGKFIAVDDGNVEARGEREREIIFKIIIPFDQVMYTSRNW
jgi:hypothetical protein